MSWPRLASLAVIAGITSAACTAPSAVRPVAPAATAVAERTTGPLASGLQVVEGSALMGTAFHDSGGWTAVLRIDGDASQVMEAYRTQLQAALHAPVRPAPAQCRTDLAAPPFEQLCRSGGATGSYVTRVRALLSDDDRDYLTLEWSKVPLAVPPESFTPPPPLPDGPAAPATDEEIAPAYTTDHQSQLYVVEGSHLLGDPLPNEGVGYQAVFQVTGDAAEVVRGYAAQFHDGDVHLWSDANGIVATLDQAGGAHIAVRAAGDPPFVLVRYDYD